jgi:hypothetical protein
MFRREAKTMGWWRVSADTLAGSRFVISPLAETIAALVSLERSTAGDPAASTWLAAHQPGYRALLAADPVTALLVRAMLRPRWIAGFVSPAPPARDDLSFAAELTVVRQARPDVARTDIAEALRGPVPGALDRDDLPQLAAGLLDWVWTRTVLPDWPRRRRVLEAEIVARTSRLSQRGWAAAIDDMRPGLRWLGDGRLQINAYDYPPRDISGAQLLFVPVTPRGGCVTWDEPHRYAIIYPCSGVLAADAQMRVPAALSTLLGPGRAAVLVLLDTPKSTTQLVALTGQGLGSVGRHLKVLLSARLIQRRRAGRSVLYYQTQAGHVLVAAQC